MKQRRILRLVVAVAMFSLASLAGLVVRGYAVTQPASRDFSLQVTPSPLVTTVQPGKPSTVDLKIRNAGTTTENLKVEPRSFTISKDSANVAINDTTPPDIAQWISFSQPKFTVQPGEWQTIQIHFNLPKQSGFSYSFALIINRQNEPAISSGRLIKGSVAVFTLVNVDRPGATRKLDVVKFSVDHKLYEFLPANFSVSLRNSGNTIVQPYGNLFVKRGDSQLATLAVNEKKGYILPGTTRSISTSWNSGFPYYKTTTGANGKTRSSLTWDWSSPLSKFRIGKYTASLVAVYNDGNRDIPIEGEVSFWVVPWRPILLLIAAAVGLWYLIHWRSKRKTAKAVRKALEGAKHSEPKV